MGLPPLREELALLPGPVLADGQPSHTLHDPVRNQFFQIDWPTFEVLSRWHLGDAAAIAAEIARDTTLALDARDVEGAIAFCRDNQLLQQPIGSAAEMAGRRAKLRGSLGNQLLHNYLFFRIPLVRPDGWLGRWAGRVDFFYSRQFLYLTLAALGWGLVEIYRQWERFAATLVDTLTWSGLAAYGAVLVAVKVLHELGHAFTAKRLGCRVPAMGVAFLVLWPVAYTDTNDAWKLTDRRQRLAVVAAGVLTELAVAAWATLAWAVLPEGGPRSLAFILAATTWIASLAINASPFMRFDGYFLLSDWLGIPNLHNRAFALARWDLRERLFDLGAPPPETYPPHRQAGLILFAYAVWAYRLVVFLGIAALVYAFFIKAVGILLFAVEIGWFVLLPIYREIQIWRAAWPQLCQRPRTRRSAAIALAALLLLAVPWPTRITAAGLLRPTAQWVIYAPLHAQVEALPVAEGGHVEAGAQLLKLAAPELDSRLAAAAARAQRLRWQASAGAFDRELRGQWQSLQEQLGAAEAEVAAIQAEAARYQPVAPYPGVLRDLAADLRPGDWVIHREPIARLVADQGVTAVAYLDEDEVGRVAVGDGAKFYADTPGGAVVGLEVTGIDGDATRVLPEAELAAQFGGGIVAREKAGAFYPERPLYRVTLKGTEGADGAQQHTWRGRVVIAGKWAAPGWRYARAAIALMQREAGF
ncbi:MAG TPA: HlyD family efflux transporter periplasmic adaptor subunit [Rhodocyclaceae bacterium]|nr:HlyD family efflux transporter periplasmic adaptor subunit [Rhodocyclaceae bacterium]